MNITNKSMGNILKIMRKNAKVTQKEFADTINKTDVCISQIELDKRRIYIKDLITLCKKYSYSIIFSSKIHEIKLNMLDFEPNDLLRFLRESTGKTQGEFAKCLGNKNDWSYTNEAGVNNYYANDLFELAKMHDFEIILIEKK